jgi:uncharacterized protein (DUF427 family)
MKSPGHQQHPNHKVLEKRLDQRLRVEVGGDLVADSTDVVEVDEDGYPPRFYFPRSDVHMDKLARSETTSQCPFKGIAHYYAIRTDGPTIADAVWTYEDPYEEHEALRNRLAFWEGQKPEIAIRRS